MVLSFRSRARGRHVAERAGRARRAVAAAAVSVLVGSLVGFGAAAPAYAQFPTNESVVYLAQGPSATQLMRGVQSAGSITFSNVGPAHAAATYNAIGFNEADGFIYGVRAPLRAGQNAKIVRIGPAGGVTPIKDAVVNSVIGAFGAERNIFYYVNSGTLYWTNVATPASGTSQRALQGAHTSLAADMTYLGEFFWTLGPNGLIARLNPLNGNVLTWTIPALSGHGAAGGAFTYGNGNLGFSKNEGGIVQIRVTNPSAASPTFSVVSVIAGPDSSANDATASLGDPTDLSITKTVSAATAVRGDSRSYTLAVRNNGPGVSSGYTVTDTVPSTLTIGSLPAGCSRSGQAVTCSGGRLAVGSTATFTLPVTVGGTAARGSITNTAAVLANENDPVASNNSSSVSFQVLVPSMTLDKTAVLDDDGDGVAEVGETVGYRFVVTNTGDLPLSGVTITDPLVTGIAPASADIPVGGSATFTAAPFAVAQPHVDAGTLSNTAQATGTAAGGTLTATDSVAIAIPSSPALSAVKSAALADTDGNGVADAGETIQYTIRVTNTGNVTLTGVTVDDPLLPTLTEVVELAPGAFHDFVGSYQVTASDLMRGTVVNTATATGTPPTGPPVTTPPTTTVTETTRVGISLVKSAEWTDLDGDGDVEQDDEIRYTFVVTNTGNVTLDDVRIEDPFLATRSIAVTAPTTTLAPGDQLIFTAATLTVAAGDIVAARVDNVATAFGTPGSGPEIASDPSQVSVPLAPAAPAIALDKYATLVDANSNGHADAGETITYRLVVTNTGNVTITGIEADDPMFAPGTLTPAGYASLIPGEQGVFTASYVVDQADVDAGQIVNTATATAVDPLGGPGLTVTDTATVDAAPPAPGVTVLKTAALADANDNGVADEGEQIAYSFLVRNTGNVTLTGVIVADAMFAVPAVGTLAPGQEVTRTVNYTVTAPDVAAGSVDNSATATGTPPTGPDVTSPPSDTSTETVAPGLSLVKTGELADLDGDGLAGLGEVITYSFEVRNTGNTRLVDVHVLDPFVTSVSPATAVLEPGSVLTFSASHVVTEADILAGAILNTASARGTVPGAGSVDSDPDSWSIVTAAVDEALALTKSARIVDDNGNTVADLGEHIEYSFEVRNGGNVTLTGIVITDPRVTGLPAAFDLGPGETRIVVADLYEVVQADIDAGEVLNSATALGTGPSGPVPSDPSTVTVPTPPARAALAIDKTVVISGPVNANGVADDTEVLTYTFVVVNTGNVTLDTVAVVDPFVGAVSSPDSGPLAPGAARTFTASYTVTAGDVASPNGDGAIVNTAHATALDPAGRSIASSIAAAAVPVADPGLLIDKTATLDDANGNGMADAGESVLYRFTVLNTGNVELVDVVIDDPRIAVSIPVGEIAAGASVTRQVSYLVTEADIQAQELVNSATATGFVPGVPPTPIASPEDVASVPLAPDESHLTLAKEAVLTDTNGNRRADVGERIVYRFTITNTGNRTVTGIVVDDAIIADLLPGPIASLAPGASVVVESDPYTVDENDIAAEEVRNVAAATGTGPAGQLSTLPATAIVLVEVPAAPALADTGADPRTGLLGALAAIGLGGLAVAAGMRPRRSPA